MIWLIIGKNYNLMCALSFSIPIALVFGSVNFNPQGICLPLNITLITSYMTSI